MEEAALTKPSPTGAGGRLQAPTPRVAVLIAGAVVVGVLLFAAGSAVRPFVVGLLLAYLLDPLVERFARLGLRRWLAVLVVYAIVDRGRSSSSSPSRSRRSSSRSPPSATSCRSSSIRSSTSSPT